MLLRGNFEILCGDTKFPLSNIGEILCSHIKSFCWRGGQGGEGEAEGGGKKGALCGILTGE